MKALGQNNNFFFEYVFVWYGLFLCQLLKCIEMKCSLSAAVHEPEDREAEILCLK